MIPNLPDRPWFSERELARLLGVHVSAVVRWSRTGVRGGHKLQTLLLGGRRVVLRQAVLDFLVALNGPAEHGPVRVSAEVARRRQVEDDLDRAGL